MAIRDGAVARQGMDDSGSPAGTGGSRRLAPLTAAEALDLLASVEYGRVVFTERALPAIRPVNHLVDNGTIVICTRLSASVTTAVASPEPVVVAYEADMIDPAARRGWTVVVTGYARQVTDHDDLTRLKAALTPWVRLAMDTVIRITPELITGFRLVDAQA